MGAVVTGIGCVTPIGIGYSRFAEGLRGGRSGIGRLSICDPAPHECRVVAEIGDFDPTTFMDAREAKLVPRVAQLAVAACRLALDDAGLGAEQGRGGAGVIIGTSSGPIAYSLEQYAIYFERGMRRVHPSMPAYGHNGMVASECAIQLGCKGLVLAVSSACTSGADAIGLAKGLIESGAAEVVLAGGADAPICPSVLAGFERLRMMPTSFNEEPAMAARPFDRRREGLVLGEGAAILVLEDETRARDRGATIRAEVAGYGGTCDAGSHFKQQEGGEEAIRAMRQACRDAGVSSDLIDYVNAHGTGTVENDPFEARVLRALLGDRVEYVPVSSSKSQFGHLLGAAGAVEAAATIAALEGGFVPPTLNLEDPDPDCELLHIRGKAQPCDVSVAMSTSFGFGSRNAALVLRRA